MSSFHWLQSKERGLRGPIREFGPCFNKHAHRWNSLEVLYCMKYLQKSRKSYKAAQTQRRANKNDNLSFSTFSIFTVCLHKTILRQQFRQGEKNTQNKSANKLQKQWAIHSFEKGLSHFTLQPYKLRQNKNCTCYSAACSVTAAPGPHPLQKQDTCRIKFKMIGHPSSPSPLPKG